MTYLNRGRFAIDEGGPLEIGFQEQDSNHLQAAAVRSRWWSALGKKGEENLCGAHPRDERK